MTPEERFARIEEHLQSVSNRIDILTKLHLDADREHAERAAEHEKQTAERLAEHARRAAEHEKQMAERAAEHAQRAAEHAQRVAEHEKQLAELRSFARQMTAYAADVKDSIKRLTNIAEAHSILLDDHDKRLEDLEGGQ